MNPKDIIITLLSGALLFIFLTWIATLGIERIERAECIKWAQQSQEYQGFYLADWQVKQCQEQFSTNLKSQNLLNRILADKGH